VLDILVLPIIILGISHRLKNKKLLPIKSKRPRQQTDKLLYETIPGLPFQKG
jgi:hypothetical protein